MYEEIEKYIEDMKIRGMAESTIESYEIHLRHFYSYCNQFGIEYLKIRTRDMKEYIKKSVENGDKRTTVNIRLSAIKSFYDYLMDIEKIEYNPISRKLYLKGKTTKTEPLSADEKNMVLTYFESKPEHINLIFKVLFATGLRVSEIASLKNEDIKIINNRVVIHVYNSKRNNERYVPIFDSDVATHLLHYVKENKTNPIFKIKKRGIQYHAKKCGEDLGIYFTVHQTRHTFATEKLHEGMRIDILQKILGHKDISTTMLYARTANIDVINSAPPVYKKKGDV